MKTIAQYIIDALKAEKITHVFLVPGGWIDPLVFTLAHDADIQIVVACHEGGAAYMADGYARSSKRFGACFCLSGPGITNTVTAIATAKTDLSPILVISGEVQNENQGRGAFQDSSSYGIDSCAILQSITSMQMRISHPDQIPHNLERILRKMLSFDSKGPVYISIPVDIQKLSIESVYYPLPKLVYQPRFVDQETAKGIFPLLAKTTKIAILAGGGVNQSGAEQALVKFAERFNIPVATTLGGRGVISDKHPLALGMLGWCGHRPASELLLSKEVETLIIIGSRLNQLDTLNFTQELRPKKQLILNDVIPDRIYRSYPVDYPILGDAKTLFEFLNSINNKETECLLQSTQLRQKWIDSFKENGSFFYDENNQYSEATPIHPARLIYELRTVMPENTVLYVDSGAHTFFAAHYWTVNDSSQFISTLKYMGAMGWGVPAAIGSQFARPHIPHVVVTGDGCMAMHGVELQTAARYKLPMIIVISNNSALGNPLLRSEMIGVEEAAIDRLPTHDWVKFAESLGAVGLKITDPSELNMTFQKALALRQTVVIDVITGNLPTPTTVFDHYFYQKKK